MYRFVVITLLLAFGVAQVPAQTVAPEALVPSGLHLSLDGLGGYSTDVGYPYDRLGAGLAFADDFFSTAASVVVTNDGKYNPSEAWMYGIGDQYFLLDEGYARFASGHIAFEGGYLKDLAPFDDPYELFLNPLGHSSRGMDLVYQTDRFYFESRWIGINYLSAFAYGYGDPTHAATQWVDKGMNYHVIGAKVGGFFFGLEDSVVYLGRNFDALYFLSPLPSILIRSIFATGLSNNPWDTVPNNDHSLMGLFGQYQSGPLYLFARALVNDLNLNFIFGDTGPFASGNVNKLAWSLGGRFKTSVGTFGLFHAGATDYTYAASYPDPTNFNVNPLEYTYYPVVSLNGSKMVDITDNYIGFQYGEDALAFMATFDTTLMRYAPTAFDLSSALEFVINGSKSPDKPLHAYNQYDEIPQKIQIFANDPVLEYILTFRNKLSKQLGPLTLTFELDIGYDLNKLGIGPINASLAAQNAPLEYQPLAGVDEPIFSLTIGGTLSL